MYLVVTIIIIVVSIILVE